MRPASSFPPLLLPLLLGLLVVAAPSPATSVAAHANQQQPAAAGRGWLQQAGAAQAAAALAQRPLCFRPGGGFKVLQLTDMHLGEVPSKDARTFDLLQQVVAAERPVDLLVFSGDLWSGFAAPKGASGEGWVRERWAQLTAALEPLGVPYAIGLGNHDSEADLTRRQICEMAEGGSPLSLTRAGPPELPGGCNYHLHVLPSASAACRGSSAHGQGAAAAAGGAGGAAGAQAEQLRQVRQRAHTGAAAPPGAEEAPAARIWVLDSMRQGCQIFPFSWGCVEGATLDWMRQQQRQLGTGVRSLAFAHIPVPEFMGLWNSGEAEGVKEEAVCCPVQIGSGLWGALRAAGVTALYQGHDHNNNYCGARGGVRLAYGQKSGYGSYGPMEGWTPGARVVLLREGEDPAQAQTWVRLHNGTATAPSRCSGARRGEGAAAAAAAAAAAMEAGSTASRDRGAELGRHGGAQQLQPLAAGMAAGKPRGGTQYLCPTKWVSRDELPRLLRARLRQAGWLPALCAASLAAAGVVLVRVCWRRSRPGSAGAGAAGAGRRSGAGRGAGRRTTLRQTLLMAISAAAANLHRSS